jgi:hypothetical protein
MADIKQIAFQYQVPKKMIGTFVVDAFLAEHYNFSNSVTDIPVEEGSTIADHIVEDQDVISVEAFIGNTAFEVVTIDGKAVSNLEAPDRMARVIQSYHELKKLAKAKKLVNVVLGLETFTNMAITSFVIDREAGTGANLPFSMEFRKLKIEHSDTTKINASTKEAGQGGDQTASTVNAGLSGTEQPDNSVAKREWRFQIESGGPATPAQYEAEFGEPYIP